MPYLRTPNAGNISIRLDDHPLHYLPGHIIRGDVSVESNNHISIGSVSIALQGRAKTLIRAASGQASTEYSGCATFVDVQQTLYDGHYTHKEGTYTWPFSITVPTTIEKGLPHEKWVARDGFADTTDWKPHRQLLPASASLSGSRVGRCWQGDIEYTLEAILTSPNQAQSSSKISLPLLTSEVRAPIDLHVPSERMGTSHKVTIRSWKLLPEHHSSPPPLWKRSKSLFGSASSPSPKFAFDVDVSYPSILQLDHPEPVPFVIGIRPITSPSETNIFPDAISFYRYPSVTIEKVSIDLCSTTKIRCHSLMEDALESTEHRMQLLSKHPIYHRLTMRSMASDQKVGAEDDSIASFVDIGEMGKIKLPTCFGGPPEYLAPSVKTFNISHTHQISWTIELSCAGEKHKLRSDGTRKVVVLRSASSTKTPSEGPSALAGPPPTYIQSSDVSGHVKSGAPDDTSYGVEGRQSSSYPETTVFELPGSVQQIMRDAKVATERILEELPPYEAAEERAAMERDTKKPQSRAEGL